MNIYLQNRKKEEKKETYLRKFIEKSIKFSKREKI